MKTTIAVTERADAASAAEELTEQLSATVEKLRAIVLFAAPTYDHPVLLRTLGTRLPEAVLVGASSAGEFANGRRGEGMATALGLSGDDFEVKTSFGRQISADPVRAAQELIRGLSGISDLRPGHRTALVMTDALAGHADRLVDELTLATAGLYQFFGGGAGDKFKRTTVFCGHEVMSDAAVVLEIISEKPIGIGVSHGWVPASRPLRVTAADGLRLISLNGLPAAEAFEAHALETRQTLDLAAPIPFFLHNILGIETSGSHRLRVPLAIQDDGSKGGTLLKSTLLVDDLSMKEAKSLAGILLGAKPPWPELPIVDGGDA